MDADRFDALSRHLGTLDTRRRLLRLLAALPLGSALATRLDEAAAERPHDRLHRRTTQHHRKQRTHQRHHKHHNKHHQNGGGKGGGKPGSCTPHGGACQRNNDCCGGNCFGQVCADRVTACGSTTCQPPATGCCGGTCCSSPANQCNQDGLCCAPNCADKQCGPDGCGSGGSCGTCPSGQRCDAASGQCGECEPACQGTQTCCDGTCVDTDTDPKNCGFCDFPCIAGAPCIGGTCQGGCVPPFKQCLDGTCCDTSQCQFCQAGHCVHVCQEGQRCANDTCICDAQSCPKGCCKNGDCKAVDTNSDPDNCGFCGHKCAAGVPCAGGVCQGGCDPRDPNVEQCPDGSCCHLNQCQFCKNGTCVSSCPAGQRCVNNACICDGQSCPKGCCKDGQCVPLLDQGEDTCGIGGETCVACHPPEFCCGGSCCRAPEDRGSGPVCCLDCCEPETHGTCVELSSDPNNCGACFHKCTADQHCVGGQCVCDGTTCPHGCCDAQGRCQPGTTNQVCGRSGGPCATCGSGNHCVTGQCICDAQSCTFFQCCENGPGNPGRCVIEDDAHCGYGGVKCVECGFLEECNVARGQCQ